MPSSFLPFVMDELSVLHYRAENERNEWWSLIRLSNVGLSRTSWCSSSQLLLLEVRETRQTLEPLQPLPSSPLLQQRVRKYRLEATQIILFLFVIRQWRTTMNFHYSFSAVYAEQTKSVLFHSCPYSVFRSRLIHIEPTETLSKRSASTLFTFCVFTTISSCWVIIGGADDANWRQSVSKQSKRRSVILLFSSSNLK